MSRSVVPGAEAGAPWPPRRNDCLFLALNRFERLIGGEQVMVNPSGDVADWMRVEAVRGPRSFRRVTRAFAAASNHRQEDLMDMEDGHDETAGFFVELDVRSGRGAFGIDPGAGGAKGLCGWGRSTQ
jgi:hypothetical protein